MEKSKIKKTSPRPVRLGRKESTSGRQEAVKMSRSKTAMRLGEEAKKTGVAEAVGVAESREARAVGRYLKISPTKVRGVLGLVRGRTVVEARRILRFSPRKGARFALKVLDSAVANARRVSGTVGEENWVVSDARADKGPVFRKKRDPKARGSWGMIATPSTHLKIVISAKGESASGGRRGSVAGGGGRDDKGEKVKK